MKSASSSASFVSSCSIETGLIAVFLRLFALALRAFLVGVVVDFSINGMDKISLKVWKFVSSTPSMMMMARLRKLVTPGLAIYIYLYTFYKYRYVSTYVRPPSSMRLNINIVIVLIHAVTPKPIPSIAGFVLPLLRASCRSSSSHHISHPPSQQSRPRYSASYINITRRELTYLTPSYIPC